ncbi:MAG: hypothetical protein ABIR68_01015 [Ilumatobacteraceae bacterium]
MANRSSRDRSARERSMITTRRVNAHRGEPSLEDPPRGRGWIIGVVLCSLVLVAVVVVALYHGRDSSSPAAPSTHLTASLVPEASGPLQLVQVPTAYSVTYELQSSNSDDAADPADSPTALDVPSTANRTYTTSTEQFRVQRPFQTHIDSKTGAPPGGDIQWSIVSDLGVSSSSTTGDETPSVDTITPSAGIGDWRLDAVLDDLVADKTFVLRERRSLLGRDCQVYRTGSPLENYAVTAPTDTTYADVCIDASGLVLEQVAINGGAVLEHLTATAVDVAPTLTAADFTTSEAPATLAQGGMSLELIGGPPTDASYWGFSAPPDGYTLLGRYTLSQNATDSGTVSPTGDGTGDTTGDTTPLGATTVVISYVDVYKSGADTVVVLQGPTSVEPTADAPGADATSTALGAVTIDSKLTGSQIVAHPASTQDWFVQVSGTVPRAALLMMTATMHNPPATT